MNIILSNMMFILGLIIMSKSTTLYTSTDAKRKSYGLYQKIKYVASSYQKVYIYRISKLKQCTNYCFKLLLNCMNFMRMLLTQCPIMNEKSV